MTNPKHRHHYQSLPSTPYHTNTNTTNTTTNTNTVGPEQEVTMESVTDLTKFPLLDSFHWEILRMFPRPPYYVKVSMRAPPPLSLIHI